jgi:hypothetical protein
VTTLLAGFDSAWTATNSGALVGTVCLSDGTFHGLGTPQIVDYREAELNDMDDPELLPRQRPTKPDVRRKLFSLR